MVNSNEFSGLNDMHKGVDQMTKEFEKVMKFNIGKLKDITHQVQYKKEKKCRLNKKEATMYLASDDSHIKVVFSDKEELVNFFEGKK